eukprot:m.542213 g.542213  ORF g.542213 m.542213 type:complete len:103 (+) comp22114_c0_seq20:1393-1701(+)
MVYRCTLPRSVDSSVFLCSRDCQLEHEFSDKTLLCVYAGVAKAGENARRLWKSAGTKLGKASTSFSDMVARAKEKRKSTSSAGGTEAPKSVAGEDDMYARYR